LLFTAAVLIGMMFSGFSRVMASVLSVPMCYMGVMAGFLVVSTFVVLGGFTMVLRCVLMVLRSREVVLCAFMFHCGYLSMSNRRMFKRGPRPKYTTCGGSIQLRSGYDSLSWCDGAPLRC
jgi:hypothetical protein